VTSVQATAAALRAVIPQLPTHVVQRLDQDLEAAIALLGETLATSCRQQDVVDEAMSLRTGLTESLTRMLNTVDRVVRDKATQLVQQATPAGSALPPEVSRKVQELRGKPPPKTPDKDTNHYMREITSQGWVVEKTGGNHLKVWGPAGEGPYVFGSTPSSATNNRKLRALAEQIRKKNRKDPTT
jgi:hypothetical protein